MDDDEWLLLLLDIYDALLVDLPAEDAKRHAIKQFNRIKQAWT